MKELKEIATTSPYHWVDCLIGDWYYRGFGGEEKKKHAVVWYTKAISGGNSDAMHNLAIAYDNGDLGLTQSSTKANELLYLAAEKGNARSRFELGKNYRYGKGVEIDFNRCAELWEQSAKQGNLRAQCDLACMYRDGTGVETDFNRCVELLEQSAKQGNSDAQFSLAFI